MNNLLYTTLQWFTSSVQQAPAFNEDQTGKTKISTIVDKQIKRLTAEEQINVCTDTSIRQPRFLYTQKLS